MLQEDEWVAGAVRVYESALSWHAVDVPAGTQMLHAQLLDATGPLHIKNYPAVPGLESFEGTCFHSAAWDHDVPLEGKRIAVVGSAASAVQIVPEVAKIAGHLTVLQRSPNWIMPRGRKFYSERQRALFRRFPFLVRATQWMQRFMMSFVYDAVTTEKASVDPM